MQTWEMVRRRNFKMLRRRVGWIRLLARRERVDDDVELFELLHLFERSALHQRGSLWDCTIYVDSNFFDVESPRCRFASLLTTPRCEVSL